MTDRFTLPAEDVLRARERLVLDHFHDEVIQDWDATLATFPHPHYELIAQMTVQDGDAERQSVGEARADQPFGDQLLRLFR